MTVDQRSLQIWSLLVVAALDRRTYTYQHIADLLKLESARGVSQFLNPIIRFCDQHGLPPLTILIVNKKTGIPGAGITTVPEDVNKDRERVYNFDWFSIPPPETKDFADVRGR